MNVYTDKQLELMRIWQDDGLKRLNVLSGSVRSGKTWITLVLWAFWIATMPKSGRYLMVAKTLTSLRRNVLDLLESLVGTNNFTYSTAAKEGMLFGRRIYLEGANDARSESKIRGMTLAGAYIDELTQIPEDFFVMLLSRLSDPGAKLFSTTNPDSPMHWVKQNYLDRGDELDLLHMTFLLDDNSFLDPEYVKQLKQEYVGVYYFRFVLGMWQVAEGAIYGIFADDIKKYFTSKPDYDYSYIGVDFGGNKSAHAFVATGHKHDYSKITALMSEKHPATGVNPQQLYDKLEQFIIKFQNRYGQISIIYCDGAEQTLINGIRDRFGINSKYGIAVRNAIKNRITDRIRAATSMMAQDRFFYTEDCKTLVDALCSAVYDPKKLDDERLDDGTTDIDTLDSWEYSYERHIRFFARR